MHERKRILLLIGIMTTATLLVAAIAITMLYQTAFDEQCERLVEIARTQSRLLEAVSHFDAAQKNPQSATAAILVKIRAALREHGFPRRKIEFAIGRLEHDEIVFLLRRGIKSDAEPPLSIKFDSKLAAPMRLALSKRSGIMTGPDYRGETVIAAYEPVNALNLGVVVKIDLAEIRAPFVKAGAISGIFTAWVVLIGTTLIIRISNPLIKSLEEQACALTKTNHDLKLEIRERKRTEAALATSERQYRGIFEHSGAPSIIIEDDMTISMTNSKFEQLSGYSRQEIEGRMKWTQFVHDDDLEIMMNYHATRRSGDSPIPAEYECKIIDRQGRVKNIDAKMGMIPDTLKSIGSFIDITRRKQNENILRRYKAIVDTANDFLALLDANYIFQVANSGHNGVLAKATEEIVDHSAAEVLDKKLFEEGIKTKLDQCLAGQTVRHQHWMDLPDRGQRFMDVVYSPYAEKNHGICGIVMVARDITDIKLAEKQLEASLIEKETLLRELYHRTKNNIQVIDSLLVLQSAYVNDQQTLIFFREIRNRIKAMALVHEKLYQSKNLSRVDLKDYIEDLAKSLLQSYQAASGNIGLRINADSIPVLMDTAVPCGLVINELVSNSLKHAFPNNGKGQIDIELHADKNGSIHLRIGDNGIGLPHGTDIRNMHTLGLQLVIGLVERQLGGSVELNTAGGTEFKIRFKEVYHQRI